VADLQSHLATLSGEQRQQVLETLTSFKDAGVSAPLLDAGVDGDGDGRNDYFGLDEQGNLIMVTGAEGDRDDYDLGDVEIVEETEGVGDGG